MATTIYPSSGLIAKETGDSYTDANESWSPSGLPPDDLAAVGGGPVPPSGLNLLGVGS